MWSRDCLMKLQYKAVKHLANLIRKPDDTSWRYKLKPTEEVRTRSLFISGTTLAFTSARQKKKRKQAKTKTKQKVSPRRRMGKHYLKKQNKLSFLLRISPMCLSFLMGDNFSLRLQDSLPGPLREKKYILEVDILQCLAKMFHFS